MKREFVHLTGFDKQWKALGFDDDELSELQKNLAEDPKLHPVIQGTGGIRKVRFAFENQGKSGSVRVLYIDLEKVCIIGLISAYAKSGKDNISADEKRFMKSVVEEIKTLFLGGYNE